MTTFEGVSFSGELTQLVVDQLATGRNRGREDSAPGDWLVRAWQVLSGAERSRLVVAVHEALTHASPQVRAEAIRFLDGNPSMADPERLLELVEQRWELFKGLRHPLESSGADCGHVLVQLTANGAGGQRGTLFRQTMARDPVYGIDVLATLAKREPTWAVEHIHELVAPELDPNGTRLTILVFNLQGQHGALRRAVANLVARQPTLKARLAQTIRDNVDSAVLAGNLLRQLK